MTDGEHRALAEELFNAYNGEGPNPWKTWNGAPVPPWHACGEQVQGKWIAVARHSARVLFALWNKKRDELTDAKLHLVEDQ
jgi:hypothetical protein